MHEYSNRLVCGPLTTKKGKIFKQNTRDFVACVIIIIIIIIIDIYLCKKKFNSMGGVIIEVFLLQLHGKLFFSSFVFSGCHIVFFLLYFFFLSECRNNVYKTLRFSLIRILI